MQFENIPGNRRHRFFKLRFLYPFFVLLALLFFAAVVMVLWNAILPDLLNLKQIGYGEALGLLILCRILFGNFPVSNGSRGGPGRKPWRDKWMAMTPAERAQWSARWQEKCKPGTSPAADENKKSENL